MKTQTPNLKPQNSISLALGFGISVLGFWLAVSASAQTPVITEFGGGQLTFTNISTNLEYRLQWAGSGNPTNDFFNTIEYIAPTGLNVTVPLPTRFLVATTNALSNNIFRAHEHAFGIPRGTNAKATLEWSESYGGPWSTAWNAALEVTPTGTVANAPTPHYFRVTWVNCPSSFAACTIWGDATDPAADHSIKYGSGKYTNRCMKVRINQVVTFTNLTPGADFIGYPLRAACQDNPDATITNQDFGQVRSFIFLETGYFGYYAQGFGDENGAGMSGNIWVIP
jgi:hypothetical protein